MSKRSWPRPMLGNENFLVFSYRSLTASDLTLKPLKHFEWRFVYGVKLYFLFADIQFSQNRVLKRLFFPHCASSGSASKIISLFCGYLVSFWLPTLPNIFADRWLKYIYLKSALVALIINALPLSLWNLTFCISCIFSFFFLNTDVWQLKFILTPSQ